MRLTIESTSEKKASARASSSGIPRSKAVTKMMATNTNVMPAPLLDDDGRRLQAVEDFSVEAFDLCQQLIFINLPRHQPGDKQTMSLAAAIS